MEGYTNVGGSHLDFNDLDIEGRNSDELNQDKTKRSSNAKQESGADERKRLLEIKVKVDDGNYGYVFSVQKRDSDWRWRCHLCDVVIVGQVHVETHIQSKKHQVKMGVLVHERDLFSRFEGEPDPSSELIDEGGSYSPISDSPTFSSPSAWDAVEVVPGEPAPPGMEGAVLQRRGVAQIQAILDCHRSSPLIGLEYLVELVPDERDAEPMYVCTLCDKKGDPRVAMAHLSSFNHRSKYIGINFPMANRAVNNAMPRTKAGRKGVADIVTRICAKIEEKHGRLKPLVLQQEDYNAKKNEYHKQIENEHHFRETPDENYMDIVEQDAILPNSVNVDDVPLPVREPPKPEEIKRKIAVDRSRLRTHASRDESKSSQEEKRSSDDTAGKNKRVGRRSSLSSVSSSSLSRSPSPPRSRSKSRTKSSSPTVVRRRPRSRSPRERVRGAASRRRSSRSRSPRYSRRRSRSRSHSRYRNASFGRRSPRKDKPVTAAPLTEKERWTRFRADCDKVESTLNKTLKFHEKNPEKHPMYPEEWKKFWNVRYKELQALGKDPSQHDFKPEWIEFWNKRMREMHNEEFNLKKEEIRTKFDLPKDDLPVSVPFSRVPRPPDIDNDVIVISPTPLTGSDGPMPRSWKRPDERKRSLSPWDKDDVPVHKSSRTKWMPPPRYEDSRRKESYEESRRKESYEESRRKESYEESRRKESYEESRRKDAYDDSRRKDSYEDSRRKEYEENLRRKDYEENSRRKDYEERPRRKDIYGDAGPPRRKEYGSPPRMSGRKELDPCFEDTSVVTVIRLLTAMESQLGSIGPAVNNLLASALAMEKTRPGASESLLGNPDNLVLFETVKEKLKGQLFAGIVEPGLVMATRACIQNLANMLFRAEKMPRVALTPTPAPAPVAVAPKPAPVATAPVVTVPGVGAMDKAAIATQIAAALVAEGRGNVTQAELESLISAVVGMAQASVALDKPITAAAFVQQMQPPEQKSPLEKLLSVVKPAAAPEPPVKCLFPSAAIVESPKREPTPPPPRMNLVDMEELTESDLKALLQNFKDLSTEEQYLLITYLKKIEANEPDRVENLRQFVNLAPLKTPAKSGAASSGSEKVQRRLSPFSLRLGQANPSVDESYKKKPYDEDEPGTAPKLRLDDSDDDYSFDDICAAASKKVNEKEQEAKELIRKATDEAANQQSATKDKEDEANNILREAKLMIANLMGQLPGKFTQKRSTPSPVPVKAPTPTAATVVTTMDNSRQNAGLNIDISNTLTDAAALDMFCDPIPKPVMAPTMVPSPIVTTIGKSTIAANPMQTIAGVATTTAPTTSLYENVDVSYVSNVFNTSYPMQNANYNGSYAQQSFPAAQPTMVGYPNQQYSNQEYQQANNFMAGGGNNGFYSEAGAGHDPRYPASFPNQPIPNQFRPQGYQNRQAYPNQQSYMNQFPNQQQGFY